MFGRRITPTVKYVEPVKEITTDEVLQARLAEMNKFRAGLSDDQLREHLNAVQAQRAYYATPTVLRARNSVQGRKYLEEQKRNDSLKAEAQIQKEGELVRQVRADALREVQEQTAREAELRREGAAELLRHVTEHAEAKAAGWTEGQAAARVQLNGSRK